MFLGVWEVIHLQNVSSKLFLVLSYIRKFNIYHLIIILNYTLYLLYFIFWNLYHFFPFIFFSRNFYAIKVSTLSGLG